MSLALAVVKPIGLFLSSPDAQAIGHGEVRGTLIRVFWSQIEPEKDKFDFEPVRKQLARVAGAKKSWSLGIVAGQHAPKWLIDDTSIPQVRFNFRGTTPISIPVGWNNEVKERLRILAEAAGRTFSDDPTLKLVYVPQMTANGIEGHFNGCPNSALDDAGFTEEKWVQCTQDTATNFALAFPNKALAVEVHDIKRSHKPAMKIADALWKSPALDKRVGVAIWWLSGKDDYQGDLLKALKDFPGDKYAQVIARSSDSAKFKDSDYTTVFSQAKELGIRYIEPWEIEFKSDKLNDAFKGFNEWADKKFGG